MARRFQFSLQTLLRVRELREREARRRLGAKHAELAQVEGLVESTHRQIAAQQDAQRAAQHVGALDAAQLVRRRTWVAHLRRTLAEQQTHRAQLQRELAQLQAALAEARRQTKTIEKLRERRFEAWKRDASRAEQAQAEELAQQLHAARVR